MRGLDDWLLRDCPDELQADDDDRDDDEPDYEPDYEAQAEADAHWRNS